MTSMNSVFLKHFNTHARTTLVMRRLAFFAGLLSVSVVGAHAQKTATMTMKNFEKNAGVYSFEIWARRTSPGSVPASEILVGTSSFLFDYNSAALGSPNLSNLNGTYNGLADSLQNYLPMQSGIVRTKVVVTIRFIGPTGAPLSTATPDGERLCTVTFPILNAAQPPNVHWDSLNSAIASSNAQSIEQTFVGFDSDPLPIQLVSFSASVIGSNQVRLDWSTLTETNNYGFEVQKAPGTANDFQTILNSFVPGHGTTIVPHSYGFSDVTVIPGIFFYRLKQMDLDGSVNFTDPIQVNVLTSVGGEEVPKAFGLDQNYPDPFNPSTLIQFAVPKESRVKLEVYNLLGQQVVTLVDESRPAGYYSVRFNAEAIPSGVYFYRFQAGETSFLKKMMLVK